MIYQIVRKELLVNILSLRFLFGFVVSVVMMGLVGYVLDKEHEVRTDAYNSDVREHKAKLELTKVYSKVEAVVDIPPSPLSVFSQGSKDMPSIIRISPYHIPSLIDEPGPSSKIDLSGTSNRPYNPFLRIFATIDLTFVIGVILSLFAVLLVFDSFTGEREQGTLKLVLSSSAGRAQLLIGKLMGALITIAIPLTAGFLVVLLLWSFSPSITLNSTTWAAIVLIYFLSLIYLGGFLALGLFVSLFVEESSTGLIHLLVVWVIVVVAIPSGLGYFAELLRPHAPDQNFAENLDRAFSKEYAGIGYKMIGSWYGAQTSPFPQGGESLLGITREEVANRIEYNKKVFPLKFQYAEDRYRLVEGYSAELQRWEATRLSILRPSIFVLFRECVATLCGTDIESYNFALREARQYREALLAYLKPRVASAEWVTRVLEHPEMEPTAENLTRWGQLMQKEGPEALWKVITWDRIEPLDLRAMPKPHVSLPGLGERAGQIVVRVFLLIGVALCFVVLSVWRIGRYDVH